MNLFFLILAALVVAFTAPLAIAQGKALGRNVAYNSVSPNVKSLVAYNQHLARHAGLCYPLEECGSGFTPGKITAFNASLFTQSTFSEPLTAYATGFRDPENIEETLEFIAPEVNAGRRFEYAKHTSAEEFLSDGADDDLRGIGADFPTVRYNSSKQNAKLLNRGLAIDIDEDMVEETPDWENYYTAKLLRRLQRNSLRRAVTLLSAAAVNTNKTWSTAAGKNPDGDVRAELITAANLSGIRPSRILYGDTAWDSRSASHEAQNTAGGFAAAGLTTDGLASKLAVEGVRISKERFSTDPGAAALAEIVSTKVLMFSALAGADREDPSNIKRFRGNVNAGAGGGRVGVYLRQVGDKKFRIAVEHYELIAITSTLGIRQFTVAAA